MDSIIIFLKKNIIVIMMIAAFLFIARRQPSVPRSQIDYKGDDFSSLPLIKRIPIIVLVTMSILGWLLFLYLFSYYLSIGSPKPMPNIGRIYQLNEHGSIAYLTKKEDTTLSYLKFISPLLFVIAIILYKIWKPKKKGKHIK
jgi:hypothetical protein